MNLCWGPVIFLHFFLTVKPSSDNYLVKYLKEVLFVSSGELSMFQTKQTNKFRELPVNQGDTSLKGEYRHDQQGMELGVLVFRLSQ